MAEDSTPIILSTNWR